MRSAININFPLPHLLSYQFLYAYMSIFTLKFQSPTRRTETSALQHAFEEDKNYYLKEEINTHIKRRIGGGGSW
jgi:hypothetical protein